ncbi:MAG: hypothetical protein WCB68_17310 [Pyrinomonadaceae bacterium]
MMLYFLVILIVLIGTGVVIFLYQLLIQKYYWGPQGPPKKDEQDKRGR